jgi:hypothetical protein
LSDLF